MWKLSHKMSTFPCDQCSILPARLPKDCTRSKLNGCFIYSVGPYHTIKQDNFNKANHDLSQKQIVDFTITKITFKSPYEVRTTASNSFELSPRHGLQH